MNRIDIFVAANLIAYDTFCKTMEARNDWQNLGFEEIQLFRRDLGMEVEFITIMWFDSIESVRDFAGDNYEAAVVPAKARAVLSRFDERSQHYEIKERLKGTNG